MENKIWKKLAQFRQIEISNEYEKNPFSINEVYTYKFN